MNRSRHFRTPRRRRRTSGMLEITAASMSCIEELDSTANRRVNRFIDLPRQVFSLTYLEDNETQNPDSLNSLEELRKKKWQTYMVGYLNNFTYQESQIKSLQAALNQSLNSEVPNANPDMKYVSEVSITEELSPTENDDNALVITVSEVSEDLDSTESGQGKELLKGYLLSWCNPVKSSKTLLPVLLCRGRKTLRTVVLNVLTKQFNVVPRPLTLMQEDILHLSTYCLVMLGENDTGSAKLSYKIPPGVIELEVSVPNLLNLWNHIHRDNTSEVDLDEIIIFHNALEDFCETSFGIKLECAQFQQMRINGYLCLDINGSIWSSSTRIVHVMLKYLNYMSVQWLKVKALEQMHQPFQGSTTM